MRDIATIEDIRNLVDTFYRKVREDDILASIFNSKIGERWPEHLAKMYTFWQTILLGEHTYFGSPFPPHARLPIEKEHFEHWLGLFHITVDENFIGEKATEAKWRAGKMAQMFQYKIAHFRENPGKAVL